MKSIVKLWHYFSNIGIDSELSDKESRKVKILNQGATIGLLLQTFVCISFIINFQFVVLIIGSFIILFILLLLFLNYQKRYEAAQFLVNAILPLLMVALGIFYGEKTGIQFNFIIFTTTALFFSKRTSTKLIFAAYNIGLYFFLVYFWNNYSSPYEQDIDETSGIISFIATVAITMVLIFNFLKENEFYDKKNQILLNSLAANNEELKRANQALERFAYIASHDLKTPLRTISGYTELLERDYKKGKSDNFLSYFQQIKKGTFQMNDLIKSTLEYSRLSNLETQKSWIDLNIIIKNIRNAYTNDKTVSIISGDLPTLFAEENQVLSLFQNLIENGLKYNDKDFKIIEIHCKTTEEKHLFSISDNGIGIDKKYHDQIFTMFKRLHTNQKYEGTGLGLAICEKVVAKMNGKIWLESKVGFGTTFFVELVKEG